MRILLVEDDALLGDALQVGLRQADHAVDWVRDGVSAETALATEDYAAVVLDLGLPRRDGLDVLRHLRARKQTLPVLILTARDTVDDRIRGLDAGADDYLVKPFDLGELNARLRALLRRAGGQPSPLLTTEGVTLDPATRRVEAWGKEVDLSAKEYALLHALMQQAGRALSRAQLEQHLYAWGDEIGSNTVEVYIHHLRRKLGADTIRTLRGIGYVVPKIGSPP
ncbi:MAG: DNA-binding response regulator [Rhodocyclales bacterium RIFCSPLOWO2_02_FULL_63_24]|nr:MAG: DNA-binding response regulator [Rhodocyclales bacterium GWA2_65_19]OHC70693.1 MAG: DNA-binding response regulator [Rhodocyclales bacterium RIFCSPLOWO2_02_FULL_63_24]